MDGRSLERVPVACYIITTNRGRHFSTIDKTNNKGGKNKMLDLDRFETTCPNKQLNNKTLIKILIVGLEFYFFGRVSVES